MFQYDGKSVPLEICLLRKVSSVPGVVRLLDFYERPDSYILILERPPGCKDLFDFITEKGRLEEAVARRFLRQVLQTVLACHERGVIHRDIKDENILVNVMEGVPEVQLIDFGSGAHITGETYTDFDGEKEEGEIAKIEFDTAGSRLQFRGSSAVLQILLGWCL